MMPILTTPDRLILRKRPWILGLGLIAAMLIFAAIGLSELGQGRQDEAGKLAILFGLFAIVFAVFVKQEVVIFDRPAGLIVMRVATVFRQTESSHPMEGLRSAGIAVDADGGDASNPKSLTRPTLKYKDGTTVPLTDVFSAGTGSKATADAINAWLKLRKT